MIENKSPWTYKASTHQYFYNDIEIPSVSTVAGMLNQESKQYYDILSADWGTHIHKLLEKQDKNQLDEKIATNEEAGYIKAWELFKKDYGITRFNAIEQFVWNEGFYYAGQVDRIWEDTVIDIKTGQLTRYTGLQLAGYLKAYELCRTSGPRPTKILPVQLLPNGTYKTRKKPYNLLECSLVFKALCKAWHFKNNTGLIKY